MSGAVAKRDQTIYTWRNLPHPLHADAVVSLQWCASGWKHIGWQSRHFSESAFRWRATVPGGVIEPILALTQESCFSTVQAALQRFAEWLGDDLHDAFDAPRVIVCVSESRSRMGRRFTTILSALQTGALIVARRRNETTYQLTTFYHPQGLVNEILLFPKDIERVAVEHLVRKYSKNGHLPAFDDVCHHVKRPHATDRHIRFVDPEKWGFESDRPGAVWNGLPGEPLEEIWNKNPVSLDPAPISEFTGD